MLSSNQFNAINTKISVLKTNMLSDEDYSNLIIMDNTKDVFYYLKNNSQYAKVLSEINISEGIHRGEVEIALNKFIIFMIDKLMHFSKSEYRNLLQLFILRYEIEDIKLILKTVKWENDIKDIKNHFICSDKHSTFDYKKLYGIKNLNEILHKLKDTNYYRLLLPYINNNEDEKLNFYIEMILDRYYFDKLIEAEKKLPKKQNEELIKLIKSNIDLLNLEWIYRAIKFYDISREEILNFIIDEGYKFNYNKLKDLVYKEDFECIRQEILKTEYNFLFNHNIDLDLFMERRIERFLYYKLLELYKKSYSTFARVISFIHLLEYEIRDITAILECTRYHLTPKEKINYLIRSVKVVN